MDDSCSILLSFNEKFMGMEYDKQWGEREII